MSCYTFAAQLQLPDYFNFQLLENIHCCLKFKRKKTFWTRRLINNSSRKGKSKVAFYIFVQYKNVCPSLETSFQSIERKFIIHSHWNHLKGRITIFQVA